MANKLQLTIDLAADRAISALKKLQSSTKDVNDELDDTRTAGKRVADALNKATDDIIADLKASERAAQALAEALGPEMAASIGQSKIDSYVGDLKKLGLTSDEVEADAKDLADALKRSANAADSIGEVDRAMVHLGAETDNTRSVVANFAGNAAQELPGITGAMGPLNMAIGQFAEYASEGNIQLRNFAAAGAGLGVAALAMKAIQDRMAQIAKIDAFKADRIKGYEEALKDADTEVEAIQKHLEEVGKIELLAGDANGGFWTGGVAVVKDVTKAITEMGLTTSTAAKLIEGGSDRIDAWGRAMVAAGRDAKEVGVVVGALRQEAAAYETATDNAAVTTAFLGDSMADATSEIDRGSDSLVKNTDAALDNALATDSVRKAEERAEQAIRDKNDAIRAGIDANFAAYDASNQYKQALDDLATATDDAKTSVDEQDVALKNAEQAAINLAAQSAELGAKQAEMAGKTMTAKEKQDLMVGALQMTASQLEPGSPLRKSLEEYIALLAGIPANVNTNFTRNGVAFTTKKGLSGAQATGTSWAPGGPTLVGEQGPEIVNMPRGASVVPAGPTARFLNGGGGGTTVVNQVNHIRTTADPRQLNRALQLAARRGDPSPW